jgi:hypothetical protein
VQEALLCIWLLLDELGTDEKASEAQSEPKGDPPLEGEHNAEHATHGALIADPWFEPILIAAGLEFLLLAGVHALEGEGQVVEAEAGEQGRLGIFGGRDGGVCELLRHADLVSLAVGLLVCHRSISKPRAWSSKQQGMSFNASAITSFASAGEPSFQSASANKNQPLVEVGCNCVTRKASAIQRSQSLSAAKQTARLFHSR